LGSHEFYFEEGALLLGDSVVDLAAGALPSDDFPVVRING